MNIDRTEDFDLEDHLRQQAGKGNIEAMKALSKERQRERFFGLMMSMDEDELQSDLSSDADSPGNRPEIILN